MQGAQSLSLHSLVCDLNYQPLNEDENEMKIDSHYWTDPNLNPGCIFEPL